MNKSEEDYLKVIYELTQNNETALVSSSQIAEILDFTAQSVNEKIKSLDKKGYLNFTPYRGVSLTKNGLNEAIRLIRAHRIWEVFLTTKLGYKWHEVHDIAEYLEHANKDDLIERIYNYLGQPNYCIHGNPIPNVKGEMTNIYTNPLYNFKVGESFLLNRVFDNINLLTFLNDKKVKLNDVLKVTAINDYIFLVNETIEIPLKYTKMLFTTKENSSRP